MGSCMGPFLLKPVGKDYLWGGRRLKEEFCKEIDMTPLAETWECSTHPDGVSQVVNGEHAGKNLQEILREHPEYLGRHANPEGQLPVLIKLIDAKQNLSVQVHPDDFYAKLRENGSLGKTEMWYVLETAQNAELIYGFRYNMEEKKLRQSLQNGTIDRYLQHVKVKRDDVFYVEPGTVHGIGAGILLAEIQERSNLTYRLYDYDRTDRQGRKRRLHIEKALEVMDWRAKQEPRQPMRVLQYQPGYAREMLLRCKYFQVERMLLNTERLRKMAVLEGNPITFQVLLCIRGCGAVLFESGMLPFFKGDCIFLPAGSYNICLHGKAQFLKVNC